MKIAILSRSPRIHSTRRLHEAAFSRGHEVEIIDHLKCTVLLEQGKPAVHYKGKNLSGIDAIIPRIGSSVTFYGSAIVRQFEMTGVFSTVHSQAIVRARDKLRATQLLSQTGIGVPKTIFARQGLVVEDVVRWVGGPPAVVKLLEGTQGVGVVLCESMKAATSVIQAFLAIDANILVQEFIEEAKGRDLRAFVVDGEVVGAMERQSPEGEFRSNLHRGGTARPVDLTPIQKQTALLAAKAMGLSVAGVDMLPSSRGPLVIEVNASPGLEGIERATGVDIAGKIIRFIEKNVDNLAHRDSVGA